MANTPLNIVAGVSSDLNIKGFVICEQSVDSVKFISAGDLFDAAGYGFKLLGDNADGK